MPLYNPSGAAGLVATETSRATAAEALKAGLLTPTGVKTSAYTLSAGDFVPCDTTGGNVPLTLPNAPADLAVCAAKQVILGTGNKVTVACSGSDVFNKTGGSTTATLDTLAQGQVYQYKAGSPGIWYITADDLALSQLDARYAQVFSPIAYGAKGDAKAVIDGAITSGLTALTSATAGFAPADVGKLVCVAGAGAAGAVLVTTISAYVSSTAVTVAASAGTTVTGAAVTWGTDDTTAINATVTAAAVLTPNGTVLFQAGKNYLLSSDVVVNNCTGLTIDGAGAQITLSSTGTAYGAVKFTGTCANITVKNLNIAGSGLTADQHRGIYCASGQTLTNIKILNNTIYNITVGTTFNADGGGSINGLLIEGNTIDTVVGVISGYGYGIHFDSSQTTGSGYRVVNNRITNAQRHSIYHAKGMGSVIAGNTISGHRSAVADGSMLPAIMCARSAMCTITGNTITETSDGAIYIGGYGGGVFSYGHVVAGNTISSPLNNTQLITIGQLAPSTDGYPTVITVSGNSIYTTQTGQAGIYVYNGRQITITDNQMYLGSTSGSANRGIWLTGTGDSSGTHAYSDDITVRGNRFSSASNGNIPISLVGIDQSIAAITLDNNVAPLSSSMAGYVSAMFLVSDSPFVTNPNITVGRQNLSGLTLGTGNFLLNANVNFAPDVQWFNGTPGAFTWTKPAGAQTVRVLAVGGGGQGGSGAAGTSAAARTGGGGGGGGAVISGEFPASDLTGTVTVTVGAGGSGAGAAVTGTNPGNAGNGGGNSSFGSYLTATRGFPGGAGGAGSIGAAGAGGTGFGNTQTGGASSSTGAAGGSGGVGGTGGGGAGGGLAITTQAAVSGGAGGAVLLGPGVSTAGGVADTTAPGTGSAVTVRGNAGPGGGGGASSITTNAQAGGSAAGYGGGGGGGGAATGSFNSGAGGTGGQGYVLVISYFQ